MTDCLLIVNKDTQVAPYLVNRQIVNVIGEFRSFNKIDLQKLPIIDVEKTLYIHYASDDDAHTAFRADMNTLRNLLGSAFFNTSTITFIFVNLNDPIFEELILATIRNSPLTKDKVEIIYHEGNLMLSDVGTYVAGNATGTQVTSTFKTVYIREAEKEEKQRYLNINEDKLDTVLPALTDMSALYRQRSHIEAISSGHVVVDSVERPETVQEFSRLDLSSAKSLPIFTVAGERWTRAERAVSYLIEYARTIGRRVLVINTDIDIDISKAVGECTVLTLDKLKVISTPSTPIAVINARFNQLSYIIQFLESIRGIEEIIFYCSPEDYKQVSTFAGQMSEYSNYVFVAHYDEDSVRKFIASGAPATALFLDFEIFNKEFRLEKYKKALKGIVVAQFAINDVDYIEFYDFCTGDNSEHD